MFLELERILAFTIEYSKKERNSNRWRPMHFIKKRMKQYSTFKQQLVGRICLSLTFLLNFFLTRGVSISVLPRQHWQTRQWSAYVCFYADWRRFSCSAIYKFCDFQVTKFNPAAIWASNQLFSTVTKRWGWERFIIEINALTAPPSFGRY